MTDVSTLVHMVGPDRASYSAEQLAVAERELRYRGHEHRQRFFDVRRRRGAAWDKFTRRMLTRARVAFLVGLTVLGCGCISAFELYKEAYKGMPESFSGDVVATLAIIIYGLPLAAGALGFRHGWNWGRRIIRVALAWGVLCVTVLFVGNIIANARDDSFSRPLVLALGLMPAIVAYQVLEYKRLGSIRCRVWCSMRIRRRVGHTSAELRAISP